jgi:kinesin family protein 2/24
MSATIDPLFGLIQVSSSIKIKRSDGRIHLAKVVQLSPESKSVGVEWNENGEVKGKEMLLDLVFELNNELRPNTIFKQPAPVINQQARPTAAVNIPSSGLSTSRLTLDIDTLEREYNLRPPPALPPQLLHKLQQHPVSIQTTSTPLPPPPLNGYINYYYCFLNFFFFSLFSTVTATTGHPKTSYLPSGTNNTGAARSIRRPAAQTGPSSSKIATPSSPVPPPIPSVEQQQPPPQPQLQIPPPANNKTERRLSRLHVVQPSSSTNTHNTAVSTVPEPPSSIGLHGPFGQMILDYRSTLTYSPITNSNINQHQVNQKDLRICVAVRKRPLNKREIAKKDNDVITVPNKDHCLVHVPKSKVDLTKYLDNQTFK